MGKQLEHYQVKSATHNKQLIVVTEHLRTPENVGMAIRIAEAFGCHSIYIGGNSPDITNKKVLRSARNCNQHISVYCETNMETIIQQLKEQNYTLIGLEITSDSIPLQTLNFNKFNKIALFIGAERNGISPKTLQHLNYTTHFNLFGKNSSVNVVNALSVGLYEITKL